MKAVIIVLFIGFLLVGCERGESGIDGLTGPTGADSDVDGCDFNSLNSSGGPVPEKCDWTQYVFPKDYDRSSLCTTPGKTWDEATQECAIECFYPKIWHSDTKTCY